MDWRELWVLVRLAWWLLVPVGLLLVAFTVAWWTQHDKRRWWKTMRLPPEREPGGVGRPQYDLRGGRRSLGR